MFEDDFLDGSGLGNVIMGLVQVKINLPSLKIGSTI